MLYFLLSWMVLLSVKTFCWFDLTPDSCSSPQNTPIFLKKYFGGRSVGGIGNPSWIVILIVPTFLLTWLVPDDMGSIGLGNPSFSISFRYPRKKISVSARAPNFYRYFLEYGSNHPLNWLCFSKECPLQVWHSLLFVTIYAASRAIPRDLKWHEDHLLPWVLGVIVSSFQWRNYSR